MRDIQISRPVLIALVGAVLLGGFLFFKPSSDDGAVAPPPTSVQTAATGATAGSTSKTGKTGKPGPSGATGASGPTMSASEIAAAKRAAARKKLIAAAEAAGIPLSVYEPLQQGKSVIIFFWEPSAQDDQHVDEAVNEVKQRRGKSIVVIKEKIANKSRYDGIAKVADITQTPGLVILYGASADTWQGYIDGDSLNTRVTRLTGSSN
jgi:hypothetical protein